MTITRTCPMPDCGKEYTRDDEELYRIDSDVGLIDVCEACFDADAKRVLHGLRIWRKSDGDSEYPAPAQTLNR